MRDFPPGEYSLTISMKELVGMIVNLSVPFIPTLTGLLTF